MTSEKWDSDQLAVAPFFHFFYHFWLGATVNPTKSDKNFLRLILPENQFIKEVASTSFMTGILDKFWLEFWSEILEEFQCCLQSSEWKSWKTAKNCHLHAVLYFSLIENSNWKSDLRSENRLALLIRVGILVKIIGENIFSGTFEYKFTQPLYFEFWTRSFDENKNRARNAVTLCFYQ